MPASADLLKVLAENPKSLQQDLGCMTGIFQIFDRQQAFIGRRYGSKRVSNASGEISSFHYFHVSGPLPDYGQPLLYLTSLFLPTSEEYSLLSIQAVQRVVSSALRAM